MAFKLNFYLFGRFSFHIMSKLESWRFFSSFNVFLVFYYISDPSKSTIKANPLEILYSSLLCFTKLNLYQYLHNLGCLFGHLFSEKKISEHSDTRCLNLHQFLVLVNLQKPVLKYFLDLSDILVFVTLSEIVFFLFSGILFIWL